MKSLLLHIAFIFYVVVGYAQNLIPNFSFEQYSACPNSEDQVDYATGWFKCSSNSVPVNSTPDYYNSCSSDTTFGVPQNCCGFQIDHRGCGAYMGLLTFYYATTDAREHIGIQLSSPMVIGQKYFLSFYAVLGLDKLLGGDYYNVPTNNIGMRFSNVAYDASNPVPIDNFSHLNSTAVISDTVNWTKVSGSIVADSAYQFVMLGNFYDDAHTDTMYWNCPNCLNNFGYYFIDDICVSTDSLLANGGIDAIPCTVGLNELNSKKELSIYPNPLFDFCMLTLSQGEIKEVCVYDAFGKAVIKKIGIGNQTEIDFSEFPSGMYLLKVTTKNNESITKKIIKP